MLGCVYTRGKGDFDPYIKAMHVVSASGLESSITIAGCGSSGLKFGKLCMVRKKIMYTVFKCFILW